MIAAFVSDLRFAIRSLLRTPAFAAAAILTLALGIGSTTAVFAAVYAIVFRPLPFPNADRFVQIVQVLAPTAQSPEPLRAGLTPDQFAALQENSRTLASIGGYGHTSHTFTGFSVPQRLTGAALTSGVLSGLGVSPTIGRTFTAADSEPGAEPVMLLSHSTWVRYFGGNRDVIDRLVEVDDRRARVIGVMPEGFAFPSLASASMYRNSAGEIEDVPEFWVPMSPYQRTQATGGFSLFNAYGILRPEATPEQALEEIRSIVPPLPVNREATLDVVSPREEMTRRVSDVLLVFQAGVGLILLVACVNVVNLLLTRAAHRRREMAVRLALGASRGRLASAGVAEAMVLALAGGSLGSLLAYAIAAGLRMSPPHLLPRMREVRIDDEILLFALLISAGSGLAIGLLSALRTGRIEPPAPMMLHGGTHSLPRRLRPSGLLVVAEVAASMVLLVGAGLLMTSFVRLIQVDPGIQPDGGLTFQVALPRGHYAVPAAQQAFVRDVAAAVRALPGVDAAGASSYSLEGGPIGFVPLRIKGQETSGEVRYRFVTGGYFDALGIPFRSGRDLRDDAAPASDAIVNEAFVRRYMRGINPVGAVIDYGERRGITVVGVVGDSRRRLDEEAAPMLYLAAEGNAPFVQPTFVVRAPGAPNAVMSAIREIVARQDPRVAVYNAMTLEEMLAHAATSARLYGLVSLACAAIAVLLAGIGLYGVLAYSVGSRTHEFAIRMALGARAGPVIAGVMRQGLALAAAGIAVGVAAAYYATRMLDGLLFSLTPQDPATIAMTTAVLLLVATVASYIPSRRATGVNPSVALRAE